MLLDERARNLSDDVGLLTGERESTGAERAVPNDRQP